jgi:hypothetical protein
MLENLRGYSIKSAFFNFAAAWKEMKTMTLANGWTKLLQDAEPENYFKGFETSNFHAVIKRAADGVSVVTNSGYTMMMVISDPSYQILSQEEIAESVLQGTEEDNNIDEEDDDVAEE